MTNDIKANFIVNEKGECYFGQLDVSDNTEIKNDGYSFSVQGFVDKYNYCKDIRDRIHTLSGQDEKISQMSNFIEENQGKWTIIFDKIANDPRMWNTREELQQHFYAFYNLPGYEEDDPVLGDFEEITGADDWVETSKAFPGQTNYDNHAFYVMSSSIYNSGAGTITIEEFQAGKKRGDIDSDRWLYDTEITLDAGRTEQRLIASYIRYPLKIKTTGQISSLVVPLPTSGRPLGFYASDGSVGVATNYRMFVDKERNLQIIELGYGVKQIILYEQEQYTPRTSIAQQKKWAVEIEGCNWYPIMRIGMYDL